MNIAIFCEESQAVCKAMRANGHRAFSFDLQECSGGHPEWHVVGDCLPMLNGNCTFTTKDTHTHTQRGRWDMIICNPPCTHLSVSGARHFEKKRADGRQRDAIELFCQFLKADCERVAIENPVNIISGDYVKQWFPNLCEKYGLPIKPQQTINPFEFGNPARKKTCLWLRGLQNLKATNVVTPKLISYKTRDGRTVTFSEDYCKTGPDRGKGRSKTYSGIAQAMADQWAGKAQEATE